jgi:hypothetical protein
MSKQIFMVFTNPVPGQEKEFNDWYDDVHLDDVLKVPGIVSAARYKLGPVQRQEPPYKFQYVALYEIDTDDVASVVAELKRRGGTDEMPLSPALANEIKSFIFVPMKSE